MNQQNPLFDVLRKETIRIILERFQGDMISKMDFGPTDQPVSEEDRKSVV